MFAIVAFAPHASAAEVYSNATGGGAWSDPATWRGGKVPAADDDVVLARDDTVLFDRNDEARVTCHVLSLDPRSVLLFKSGGGAVVFTASGPVDCYGTIKLDASKAAADRHELRLAAETVDDRTLKVSKGGGLVVAGRTGLPKGRRNAIVRALAPPVDKDKKVDPPPDPTAVVEVTNGTLDVQRAELENVYLQGMLIDNTGAKAGERVNISRSRFIGTSRLLLTSCDTPLVADNLFERDAQPALQQAAMYLNSCPLSEVRGNTVRGTYGGAMSFYGQTEGAITNNLIEKCSQGLYFVGANGMIRGLTIRECGHGITMTSASGAMEDVLIEKCSSGYYHGGATVQITNLVFKDMPPNAAYDIHCSSGPLTLVNCNIKPTQIQFAAGYPMPPTDGKPSPPPVTSLQYVVANVKGSVTPGTGIELKTAQPAAPLPAGAADPNVRNSPAPVASSGYTPLPKTLEPLIVKSWSIDFAKNVIPAPAYRLSILAPQAAGEAERKVLKTVNVTPQDDWYRPNPNELKPTIEVTLP